MSAKLHDRLLGAAGSAAYRRRPRCVCSRRCRLFSKVGARVEQVVDDDWFGWDRCAHVGVDVSMCASSLIGAHLYARYVLLYIERVSMYTGKYAMRVSACKHSTHVAMYVRYVMYAMYVMYDMCVMYVMYAMYAML